MIDPATLQAIDDRFEELIERERTGIQARIARLRKGEVKPHDHPYIHAHGDLQAFVRHLDSSDNGVRIASIMWQNLVKELRER